MYNIDSHIADLLIRNGRVMWRLFARRMEESGINASDAPILICLWSREGRRQVEIAKFVGVEPAALTRPLDRMEKEKLIKRKRSRTDRRAHEVYLTNKGKNLRASVNQIRDDIEELIGQHFSQQDLVSLKRNLIAIFNMLEAEAQHPKEDG